MVLSLVVAKRGSSDMAGSTVWLAALGEERLRYCLGVGGLGWVTGCRICVADSALLWKVRLDGVRPSDVRFRVRVSGGSRS